MKARLDGGGELKFGSKTDTPERPLITIITSTFNAASDLQWTLQSVRAQTYPNIQWIVADGGSTDGTVELLKENEDIIDYWFSEPDRGIYDAWNKALKFVKGSWVQFIGAGDEIYDNNTIEVISKFLSSAFPQYEMVYGKIKLLTSERKFLKNVGSRWSDLNNKWQGIRPALPVHPEVYHHVSIFNKYNCFDINLTVSADTELLYKSMSRLEPLFVDVFIDKMPLGGVSDNPKYSLLAIKELSIINKRNNISPPFFNYLKAHIFARLKILLYFVFPKKIYLYFLKKYKE